MVLKKIHILLFLVICVVASSCHHAHVTVSADVKDLGEHIRTKYRYKAIRQEDQLVEYQFAHLQPDVFDNTDGVPITLNVHKPHRKDVTGGGWTGLCSALTALQFPYFRLEHSHKLIDLMIGSTNTAVASFDVCSGFCEAHAMNPLPLLFYDSRKSCFDEVRKFSKEGIDWYLPMEMDQSATAYGVAVKLKELEDAGIIDESLAVRTRINQQMADHLVNSARITAEARRRFGTGLNENMLGELKILKCEREKERDSAYRFVIVRKDGRAPSFADYNNNRNAIRDALRAQYSYTHPDVGARYLAVDFNDYSLREARIEGLAVILTISPKYISYNSASRTGKIGVVIGANQFEDARRWMRKNIEDIATKSNIDIKDGDPLPQGARFYIGRETLSEDGTCEVEFRTE